MNKKLVVAAALVFGVAGLMLTNTVKAQDATDNTAMMNSDNSAMNADNAAMPADNAAMPADNTAAVDNTAK